MDRFSRFSVKAFLLPALLLLCFLAGCGWQGSATRSESQSIKTPQESCQSQGRMQNLGTHQVAYTVSWDAVATDADNNQGRSTLHISALDITTGKLLWQTVPAKITTMYQSSSQQVVDGVLYIAAANNAQNVMIMAVNTQNGHALWQREEKWDGVSNMNICAGKVYLNIGHSAVKVLQTSNGKLLWSYSGKNGFLSNLVATPQALYMVEQQLTSPASVHTSVIALGDANGNVLWRKSYGQQPWPRLSLVTNGPAVYVINQVSLKSSEDPTVPVSSIQALDVKSSKVLWTAKMPPNMEQINVRAFGNILYLNGQDLLNQNLSLLVALNISDGKQLWQRKHSYDQLTLLSGQDLFGYQGYAVNDAPQAQKRLCLLDSTTGKDRWCIDHLQPSLFSLSTTNDIVIVQETLQPGPLTLDQNLYGVNKQNGKILWKLPWKSSSASVQTLTLVTVIEGQSFTSIPA